MIGTRSARRRPRRALYAILWGLGLALALQIGLAFTLETCPDLRDPEFGRRAGHLNRRIAENPTRPLTLVFGSSRVAIGLRPGEVPPNHENDPLIFNFGVLGGGPRMQQVYLRRLLASGVRPTHVYAEFWPPFSDAQEMDRFAPERFNRDDVSILCRYSDRPCREAGRWRSARLAPWYGSRFLMMSHTLPNWLKWTDRKDATWGNIDGLGWARQGDARPEGRPARVEFAREFFQQRLADMPIDPAADRAIRDLVALCRAEGIGITLLMLPDSDELRAWYGEPTRCRTDAWLSQLRRDLDVNVIDARHWSRNDDFMDAVHLTPDGATAFTRRFINTVRSGCEERR